MFLTWRPTTCQVRLVSPASGPTPTGPTIKTRLASVTTGNGGRLVFYPSATAPGVSSIDLDLPVTGAAVPVMLSGEFGFPSSVYGDVAIEARYIAAGSVAAAPVLRFPLMVRVRKNANVLSISERDRFVSALATLNGQGAGIFRQYRDTHVGGAADRQAHGEPGFLPWHRAYLLDLERELQVVDATVALPYWRFDQAAPNVINSAFMGVPNSNGTVTFRSGHPLTSWVTDGQVGVFRGPGVTASNIPQPQNPNFRVLTDAQTMALSSGTGANCPSSEHLAQIAA